MFVGSSNRRFPILHLPTPAFFSPAVGRGGRCRSRCRSIRGHEYWGAPQRWLRSMRRASVMPRRGGVARGWIIHFYRLVADIKLERRYLTHRRDEGRRFRAGGEAALMVWDPLPALQYAPTSCKTICIQLNNTGITENIAHVPEQLRDDGLESLAAARISVAVC